MQGLTYFPRIQTKTEKNNPNPFWGKLLTVTIYCKIPFSEPTINENFLIQLYDWDFATKNEIVGSTAYKKTDIVAGKALFIV